MKIKRLWIEIFLASAAGAAELIIWQRADTDPSYNCFLFIYPFIAGLLAGLLGQGSVWIIGPATMLCLPVGMLVETLTGGGGLNLWPIALMFYAALAAIGLIGAAIGRGGRQYWAKNFTKHDG